jgi:hypothetical protein
MKNLLIVDGTMWSTPWARLVYGGLHDRVILILSPETPQFLHNHVPAITKTFYELLACSGAGKNI